MKRADRACPHPGCGALIDVAKFACWSHWRGLPGPIRDEINAAYVNLIDAHEPEQFDAATERHEAAKKAATDWWETQR